MVVAKLLILDIFYKFWLPLSIIKWCTLLKVAFSIIFRWKQEFLSYVAPKTFNATWHVVFTCLMLAALLRVDLCPGTWHLSDNLWLNTSRRQYLYWWEWYIAFIVDIFSMLSIKVTTIHIYDCSSFLRVLYTTICFKNSVISSSIVDTTGTTFLSSMFLKTDWFQTLVSNLRIAQFNATGNQFTKKITKRHV